MRIIRNLLLIVFLLSVTFKSYSVIPERSGWWKFDNPSNPLAAESGYGTNLELVGTHSFTSGPQDGNGAVLINSGSYYKMRHGLATSGLVNEYTLQFDFKVASASVWHSFFQTSDKNNDDGDFFINTGGNIGVGVVGYSGYTVSPNQWYRLVISVKNNSFFNCYLDGNPFLNGSVQAADGRFALDSILLLFADDDGEDGPVFCSELAIWNKALTIEEANELGGYGHDTGSGIMTRIPFLQAPGQTTMTICWHDTSSAGTRVDYNTDSSLSLTKSGTNELISPPFRWHTVKLTGLQAGTQYFYKVFSGNGSSEIYSFRTLPAADYSGKLRFLILSDTHASDTTMAGKVLRAAREKIIDLYGPDIENDINGIFHSGDIVVSGNSPEQYTMQFFQPFSVLSPYIPTMVVAGNHEGESQYFYKYLKIDDLSIAPANPGLNEKLWQLRTGNALFIGMNTNIIDEYGNAQASWLNKRLGEAEADAGIDFVYLFFHHPPYSEMWAEVNTFDKGSNYVRDVLFPVIKKYSKVQQIHTGHTHGFERGTVTSPVPDGDFRTVCGGGGGGPLDNWGAFQNIDYHNIQISYDHYFFQILEIDIEDHSWNQSMYSLGNLNKPRNSEKMDSWYKKLEQSGPDSPVAEGINISENYISFSSSPFSGIDSIMTVQLQISESSGTPVTVIDTLIHWTDIYGVDASYNPIDKNKDVDLFNTRIPLSRLEWNKAYSFRVRYRDHNLRWSPWSDSFQFSTVGITNGKQASSSFFLNQNFPNPCQRSTTITYNIPERSDIVFRIYNSQWKLISEINDGSKNPGIHKLDFNTENLGSGIYFYKLNANKYSGIRKMIKIN